MVRIALSLLLLAVLANPLESAELLLLSLAKVGYKDVPVEVEHPQESVYALLEMMVTADSPFYAKLINDGHQIVLRGKVEAEQNGTYRVTFFYEKTKAGDADRPGKFLLRSTLTVRLGERNVVGGSLTEWEAEGRRFKSDVRNVLTLAKMEPGSKSDSD